MPDPTATLTKAITLLTVEQRIQVSVLGIETDEPRIKIRTTDEEYGRVCGKRGATIHALKVIASEVIRGCVVELEPGVRSMPKAQSIEFDPVEMAEELLEVMDQEASIEVMGSAGIRIKTNIKPQIRVAFEAIIFAMAKANGLKMTVVWED